MSNYNNIKNSAQAKLNEIKKEYSQTIPTGRPAWGKIFLPYIYDSSLGHLERILLIAIANMSQPNGYAFPCIKSLMELAGINSRTPIIEAFKNLEEGGYLISGYLKDKKKIYVLVDIYSVYPFLLEEVEDGRRCPETGKVLLKGECFAYLISTKGFQKDNARYCEIKRLELACETNLDGTARKVPERYLRKFKKTILSEKIKSTRKSPKRDVILPKTQEVFPISYENNVFEDNIPHEQIQKMQENSIFNQNNVDNSDFDQNNSDENVRLSSFLDNRLFSFLDNHTVRKSRKLDPMKNNLRKNKKEEEREWNFCRNSSEQDQKKFGKEEERILVDENGKNTFVSTKVSASSKILGSEITARDAEHNSEGSLEYDEITNDYDETLDLPCNKELIEQIYPAILDDMPSERGGCPLIDEGYERQASVSVPVRIEATAKFKAYDNVSMPSVNFSQMMGDLIMKANFQNAVSAAKEKTQAAHENKMQKKEAKQLFKSTQGVFSNQAKARSTAIDEDKKNSHTLFQFFQRKMQEYHNFNDNRTANERGKTLKLLKNVIETYTYEEMEKIIDWGLNNWEMLTKEESKFWKKSPNLFAFVSEEMIDLMRIRMAKSVNMREGKNNKEQSTEGWDSLCRKR